MTDPSVVAIQALAVPWLRDVESAGGHYLWLDFAPVPANHCCILRFRGNGHMQRNPDYGYIEGMMTLRYTDDLVFPPFMMEHGLAPRQLFLCHFEWEGAYNPVTGYWDGNLVPQLVLKERLSSTVVQIRWERCLHLLKLWGPYR
jgi:hypothetical protein